MVHSSPFLTSCISFLNDLMLLANIPVLELGVPFLNMYSLQPLLIFPELIITPGTYKTSLALFLLLIGKMLAMVPLPF